MERLAMVKTSTYFVIVRFILEIGALVQASSVQLRRYRLAHAYCIFNSSLFAELGCITKVWTEVIPGQREEARGLALVAKADEYRTLSR